LENVEEEKRKEGSRGIEVKTIDSKRTAQQEESKSREVPR